MQTIHLLVKGKVQGVFFRATAKKVADRLNLTGWIRNTDEGHVEAVVSGPEEDLLQFIQWCRRGPDKSFVEHLDFEYLEVKEFTDFSVIRG